jgi:hypothetical protein
MNSKINILKNNFNIILNMRKEIYSIFENLEMKILKLKDIYFNLHKSNNDNNYTFGLDSLFFQRRLIDVELKHMKQFNLLLNNRIYCEYYKLFKIISSYVKKNYKEQKLLDILNVENTIVVYKDLEPYKEYDFDQIINLHELLLSIINELSNYYLSKELKFKDYQVTNDAGLNLNNFVNTYKFDLIIMKENIELYINYLEYFHANQIKNFKRFFTKISILQSQIIHDIKFESKNADKSMIENLMSDSIDGTIISEIKNDLDDEEEFFDLQHLESKKIKVSHDYDL